MRQVFIICLFMCCAISVFAQNDESRLDNSFLYSTDPLDESVLEEGASITFILDNTKTKIGRDLYEEFYRQWTGMSLDSTSMVQFRNTVQANEELIIELEEIPSPGLSNIVSIKVGDLLVWQQFVRPRADAMESQVAEAVQEVFQYFIGYQDIQNQLGTKDQSGSGIF